MGNVIAIDRSNALSYTQGGAEQGTFGGNFRARSVLYGDRYAEMDRRLSYYECTQHDAKQYDFDGRISNPRSAQPLMGAEKASWFVPLRMRRPSAPYRLGKIIVDSFTNLLYGENRFPALRCEADEKTEGFARAISKAGKLPLRMIQARNMGGATGTVGLSWCFYKGKPRFEVHNARNLFVHSWDDRVNLVPRHVTEVYPFHKTQWNGKAFVKVWYWFRRDWTPECDYVFEDVLWEPGKDPFWTPDMKRSVRHDDGVCHLEWIQNLPSDEVDGIPDYDGLYESFDAMDTLVSVVMRGATLNLDPTLKLKMDPEIVSRVGMKKGSDNALVVGKDGDAEYLELGGSSIEAGIKLIEMKRRSILETAQCIVPDPHEMAAQGVSSVAMKVTFAPMLGKADVLREQYGSAKESVLGKMNKVARERMSVSVSVLDDVTGEEVEGVQVLDLPPKVEREAVVGPDGEPTGEDKVTKTPCEPGEEDEVGLQWPPYFPPTPEDQNKIATTMQLATGGKAFSSKQTAVEVMAAALGVDGAEEWKRVDAQHQEEAAKELEMAQQDMGGQVGDKDQLPPGAKPRGGKPNPFGGGKPSFGGPPKPGGNPFAKKPGGFGKPKGDDAEE